MEDLERFAVLSSRNAGRIGHCDVSIEQYCKLISWRLLTRTHGTIESMNSALDSVQRLRREA